MAFPVAAVLGGIGVAQKLFGGGKGKGPDYRRAIAELRASRPTGYLTGADLRGAELTRGRLMEGVGSQAELAGYEIGRRSQARGLAGSPSEERARARLEQQKLLGTQHAGESAEEQLYNIKTGREAFERQKALAIFGAQTGQAQQEYERGNAENAAFWNSLGEFMPTIMSGISPAAQAPDIRGYGPYLPGFEPGG